MRFLVGESTFFAQLDQLLVHLFIALSLAFNAFKLLKVELGIRVLRSKKSPKRPVRRNPAKKKRMQSGT
jgi:hypothetical protein